MNGIKIKNGLKLAGDGSLDLIQGREGFWNAMSKCDMAKEEILNGEKNKPITPRVSF